MSARPHETRQGNRVPKRSRSVAWQIIDGELVLLRVKDKELLGVSDAGRRIWELSDGTRSIDQIVEAVTMEFDVLPEVARADTLRFVDMLTAARALEFDAGPC